MRPYYSSWARCIHISLYADLALVIRLLLGLTLLYSSLQKLRRVDLTSLALVDFGVTRESRPLLARSVSLYELGLGLLLILPGYSYSAFLWTFAGALATVTFLVFAFLLARSLMQGASFSCHCFGASDDAISWFSFWRAMGLAALAGCTLPQGEPTQPFEGMLALATSLALLGLSVVGTGLHHLLAQARQLRELPLEAEAMSL